MKTKNMKTYVLCFLFIPFHNTVTFCLDVMLTLCKFCLPVNFVIFQGVGTVISGTCLQGIIRLNDVLLLGPDSTGQFAPVAIKGIHRKRMPVREVRGGQTCSFALKKVC